MQSAPDRSATSWTAGALAQLPAPHCPACALPMLAVERDGASLRHCPRCRRTVVAGEAARSARSGG